jgi:hypothetical protein
MDGDWVAGMLLGVAAGDALSVLPGLLLSSETRYRI